MPLPSSGPLSLNDIQTEFGGTNPIGLNEYYAGGGLVPAGTTGTNGAVPSSGAISIFNFYGTSNIIPYWSVGIDIGGNPAALPNGRVYVAGGNLAWVEQDFTGTSSRTTLTYVNATSGGVLGRYRITSTTSSGSFSNDVGTFVNSSGVATIYRNVNSGNFQIFQINNAGTIIWSKKLDNRPPDFFGISNGVTGDASGNIYVLGYRVSGSGYAFARLMKLDSTGAVLWAREIQQATYAAFSSSPTTVTLDSSGNVYVGITGQENASPFYYRPFIVKLDSNGNSLGAVVINYVATSNTYLGPLVVAPSGNIYGWMQAPGSPVSVFKLNSSLAVQWIFKVNDVQGGQAEILLDSSENVYVPYSNVGNTYGIVSLTSAGAFRWAQNLTFAPTPGDFAYLNNLGIAIQGTSLFALTNSYNAMESPANVGNIIKFPTSGGLSGFYPTVSPTRGIFFGTQIAPGSVTDITANFTVISVSPSLTTLTWTTSNQTNPTVAGLSYSVTNYSYNETSSNRSYVYFVPGTYTWIAPSGVTSVSVVAVGGGGGGTACYAGGGGGLGYANNVSVTPGNNYFAVVGTAGVPALTGFGTAGGRSSFGIGVCAYNAAGAGGAPNGAGGFYVGNGGGQGGSGNSGGYGGGGGAGGYSGNGGRGAPSPCCNGLSGSGGGGGGGGGGGPFCSGIGNRPGGGRGGGVAIIGEGSSGAGGSVGGGRGLGGSFATGYCFGGGGASGGYYFNCWNCPCNVSVVYNPGTYGGRGAVRIVWPGNTRSFPSTNVRPL